MKVPKIATVINFCSSDYPFLKHCVLAAAPFSQQILIPVCDHFYDGQPEDLETLKAIYAEFPFCTFLQYPFHHSLSLAGCVKRRFLPNLARLLSFYFTKEPIDYLFFLDADEIVETEKFLLWLEQFPLEDYDAVRLACYWYFREARHQSLEWEDTPLLIKKTAVSCEGIMDPLERAGLFDQLTSSKLRYVKGVDERPLIHHYSWVRTKEQLLHKVATWSHRNERQWHTLLEEEFSRPFSGRDFVHGYSFKEVFPYIDLDVHSVPQKQCTTESANHVRFLTDQDMIKIDLSLRFNLCL